MTFVINLIGAPGVGKSVCASLLFAELKLRGYSVEYVHEYAKQFAWNGDTNALNDQDFITTGQYNLLKNVYGKVDYIVTDSPLFLGLYYNLRTDKSGDEKWRVYNKITNYINEFKNIYIFIEPGNFKYEQSGRIHSSEESLSINDDLYKMLKDHSITFLRTQSCKSNIDTMVGYVDQNIK